MFILTLLVALTAWPAAAEDAGPEAQGALLPPGIGTLDLGMLESAFLSSNPLAYKDGNRVGDEAKICDTIYSIDLRHELWGSPRVGFAHNRLNYVGLFSLAGHGTRAQYSELFHETSRRLGQPAMANGDPSTAEQAAIWSVPGRLVILTYFNDKGSESVAYLVTP
ncbi:MAG: hypothetical protein P9M14_07975 [Candidatus Alcyoniella australis]|nr:hypothetical protein [Candidatus Alcyoniella australis]